MKELGLVILVRISTRPCDLDGARSNLLDKNRGQPGDAPWRSLIGCLLSSLLNVLMMQVEIICLRSKIYYRKEVSMTVN